MHTHQHLVLSLLITWVAISQTGYAQRPYSVTARVLDENSVPIDLGNALLLSSTDSSLVQGAVVSDGHFTIVATASSAYLLKITALGYLPLFKHIAVANNTDLGTLVLLPSQLQAIEVIGQRPTYEVLADRTLIQLENSALSNAGSAQDVLRSAPKVVFSSSGQINVIGKGAALIYLDGQLLGSNQLLQNIVSSDIKTIEVIENPPAKYEAAGNAVINIITKKMRLEGYRISLLQEIGTTNYLRGQVKANVDYKNKAWVSQVGYSFRPIEYRIDNDYARTYEFMNELVHIDNQYASVIDQKVHTFYLKTSYELSSKQHVGIQYNGSFSHSNRDGLNENTFDVDGANLFTMDTEITGPFDQENHHANLSYSLALDTLGSQLSASAQYATYDLTRIENIHQARYDPLRTRVTRRRTYNTNAIQVRTLQADHHQYLSRQWQLDGGIKNARIFNKSLLNFEALEESGVYTLVPEVSTDYAYEENILAAYGQATFSTIRWNYHVGLRAEHTTVRTVTQQENTSKNDERDYSNIFPSATITYQLAEKISMNLSYNYRIQRPSFQDLNPFTFYADSLVSFRGNPNLVPAYSHNLSLNTQHQSWNLGITYQQTRNPINTIIEIRDLDEPAIFDFKRDNIDQTQLVALTLSMPLERGGWSSYYSLTSRWEDHRYEDQRRIVSNQTYGFYLYTNQTFQLPSRIKAEAIFQYTSPRVDGIYTDDPVSALSLAVSRKFLNDRLTARLLANDVFKNYKFTGTASVYGHAWTYRSQGDFRYLQLSLNWNFGKLTTTQLQPKAISEEELNRINRR